jgi:ribosomal protein S18 acetylase RimI-like enzyme
MLTIRPARSEDTLGLQKLIAGIYAEYACVLDLEGEDAHLKNPGPYFRERNGEIWVVASDGRVLASAAAKVHEDAGELKTLYVHPSIRRQGWGRRLTYVAIDFAAERLLGRTRTDLIAPLFVLWSDTRFKDAHRLYRAMGFAQIGERALHDLNNCVEHGFAAPLAALVASRRANAG